MSAVALHESEAFTVFDCREDKSIPLRETKPNDIFQKNDWNWASSKPAMRRTSERLSRLPKHFKVTVLLHEVMKGGWRAGHHIHDKMKREGTWQESPAHFNAVLCNNISPERNHIPLTPWMVLHRMMHCLHTGHPNAPNGEEYFGGLTSLLQDFGSKIEQRNLFSIDLDVEADNFLRLIMTSRCAREKNINSNLDFVGELFAQHHLGGVRFLRTKDWEARFPESSPGYRFGSRGYHLGMLADNRHWKTIQEMSKRPEETDNRLAELENLFAQDFERMTASMIGKTARF